MCDTIECENAPESSGASGSLGSTNSGFTAPVGRPEVQGPRSSGPIDGDSIPKRGSGSLENVDSASSLGFPTLRPTLISTSTQIPIAPAPFQRPEPSVLESVDSSSSVQGETVAKPKKKKKSRVLKPPTVPGNEALVHIDEVDSDYGVVSSAAVGSQSVETGEEVLIDEVASASKESVAPVASVDAVAKVPSRGFMPKFSIKPSQSKPDPNPVSSSFFPLSQFSIDSTATDPKSKDGETRPSSVGQQGIFTKGIDEVIGSFFNTAFNTSDLLKRRAKLAKTSQLISKSAFSENEVAIPTVGSPDVAINGGLQQCGKAPNFIPCVPVPEANRRLLQCCQRKLLPLGCHDLCRYDVTQPEIKVALDSGRCGLLSIAPFLECASDGHNNLDCCRQRGIAFKSGSQCEVFCNPAGGIGALGLQHVKCGEVVGDLLQCHHSGLV
ncbi:hypothetical protein L596_016832 [Steinernema carpocapsae]|uniref:Domain of unknown function DB domain-containing protein n=1 Tax=Steinernema carpocapsae TaxID=34508 RepID=A0A4U5NK71_STECR|nr:hypothetical protein L596_016832 [Steinernema carpocapsae]